MIEDFRRAMEAHDLSALLATFSPGIELLSPITARVRFRGHDELRTLMRVHFDVVEGVRYRPDELVYTATVRGREIDVVNRVELGSDGLIDRITVFVRPLPGLTAFAAALGPPLASARRSSVHGLALRLMLGPLAAIVALGDRVAQRLV